VSVPTVLLPYQQKWLADQSPVKVWEKSRRIGASWCEAADSALMAAADSGMDSWYIGYNKDMAQEFIRDAGFWAGHYQLAASEVEEFVFIDDDPDKGILAFRIIFASGHRVVALSSRPANLRGKQGKVIIDEAAFHDDLDGLLAAALALLIWGGRVVILSTHYGDSNPFNELVTDIRAGKKPYSLHRTTFDDALGQGLYRRICLTKGWTWSPEDEAAWRQKIIDIYGANADEELFCIPSQGSGTYFPRALIESCMDASIPVIRLALNDKFAELPELVRVTEIAIWCDENLKPLLDRMPQNQKSYYGMDFGRSGDLSVLMPLTEEQNLRRRAPFLLEMRNVPFRQQEQVLFYVIDRLPRFLGGAMDARGNGQYLAEVAMQKYGKARIHQVMLSAEWYRDNMPRLKAGMEDGQLVLAKDSDVMADYRAVKVEKGVPKVPENMKYKGLDGGQRHGDAAIAGAMAFFASVSTAAPIEFQSTGQTRASASIHDYLE